MDSYGLQRLADAFAALAQELGDKEAEIAGRALDELARSRIAILESVHVEAGHVEALPVEEVVEAPPVEEGPVEAGHVEAPPVEAGHVEALPVEAPSAKKKRRRKAEPSLFEAPPVEAGHVEALPVEEAPVEALAETIQRCVTGCLFTSGRCARCGAVEPTDPASGARP